MNRPKSREHHWWPVGLQKYWADRHGNLTWIEPSGRSGGKRYYNRKIAYKSHGHTIFRGSVWETNFEIEFLETDNDVSDLISHLSSLRPFGEKIEEFFALARNLLFRERTLNKHCKFYRLPEDIHRRILVFIFSLLIRAPSCRYKLESFPEIYGLPRSEEVGKMNMHNQFRLAKKLCASSSLSGQYITIIHSPWRRFLYGDGLIDRMTGSLFINRIDGLALVPLTPNLCIYLSNPRNLKGGFNCASFTAAPWMVDWINELTQIYSRDRIFFKGRRPNLIQSFQSGNYLSHDTTEDEFIRMLDTIPDRWHRLSLISGDARFS